MSDPVSDSVTENETPSIPVLRVVAGEPTAEELAALVAVVAASAAVAATPRRRPRSEWGHPARAHRGPHRAGPDQWRRSAWG